MEQTNLTAVQTVVADSGPLLHLEEIGCLHLLADFKRILLPNAIAPQIEYYRTLALQSKINFEKVDVAINKSMYKACETFSLNTGEMEAIALCSNMPASVLLTDDAAARLAAKTFGIRAYGTIAIVLRAVRRGQLLMVEAISKLQEIPVKSTLFIKHGLLCEIVVDVKKTCSIPHV